MPDFYDVISLVTAYSKPSMQLFLEIEYKKRHFEYYDSNEAKWLNAHWDDGVCDIFEDENDRFWGIIYLLETIFLLKYKTIDNQQQCGINQLHDYFNTHQKDWLKRILNISLKNGIMAPFLMKPLDMSKILDMKLKNKFRIITLGLYLKVDNEEQREKAMDKILGNGYVYPWISFSYNDNILNVKIDMNDKEYTFNHTLESIMTMLSYFSIRGNSDQDLLKSTRGMEEILYKGSQAALEGKMNKNSENTKLLGLLLWDLKISGNYEDRNKIFTNLNLGEIFPNKRSAYQSSYRDAYYSIKYGKSISSTEVVPDFLDKTSIYFDRVDYKLLFKEPTWKLKKD